MIVYEVKTDNPLECEPVDARELIASGAYTDKPKEEKRAEDKPKRAYNRKSEEE